MNAPDLSQKILDQLQQEHIKPKPKWEFFLKDSFIWGLVVVSLFVGSLATSVVIYMFDNRDWDLYDEVGNSLLAFIFATLPYFWLIILVIFVYFIFYNFQHTQSGYRYGAYSVIITATLFSILMGFLFYNLGLAQAIEMTFNNNVPFYQKILNNKQRVLTKPEQGIVTGRLIGFIDQQTLALEDFTGRRWLVKIESSVSRFELFRPGMGLIIFGSKLADDIFEAQEIRPLMRKKFEFFKINILPPQINFAPERNTFYLRINS